jgi:hypothetical protein
MQAIGASLLILRLRVPREAVEALFFEFHESLGGGGSLRVDALKQAMRQLIELCRQESGRLKRCVQQHEACDARLHALDGCLVAAERWEDLVTQLTAIRDRPPLDARVGRALQGRLEAGSTQEDLRLAWSSDAVFKLNKEDFVRNVLVMRSNDEIEIPLGGIEPSEDLYDRDKDTKELLGALWRQLVEAITGEPAPPSPALVGSTKSDAVSSFKAREGAEAAEAAVRLDSDLVLEELSRSHSAQQEREQRLEARVAKCMERARGMQVAYAEAAARDERAAELASRASCEQGQASPPRLTQSATAPSDLATGAVASVVEGTDAAAPAGTAQEQEAQLARDNNGKNSIAGSDP